jgi:SnoaL-like domain
MDMERFVGEELVRRVRQRWAFARDYGDWDGMRACFHPDATVHVAWFSGPCATFFERTIAMSAARRPEERSKHWFGGSRVAVNGDRAILETDAQVQVRDRFDGHLFDLTASVRMYDRVERRAGTWRIARMVVIYDKDRMDAVLPGSVPAGFFDGIELHGPNAGMAFMRFRNAKVGRTMPPDVVVGGSDTERRLRAETEQWLAGG